jgi:hypothetical protein
VVFSIESYKDSLIDERDFEVILKLENNSDSTLNFCILPTVYFKGYYTKPKSKRIYSSINDYERADIHSMPVIESLKSGESRIFKFHLGGRFSKMGIIKTKFGIRICNGKEKDIETQWVTQNILKVLK